jgi:hypothetical protein
VQLTSDGLFLYRSAVESAFGWWEEDFAQLIKVYGPGYDAVKGRYGPGECIGIQKQPSWAIPTSMTLPRRMSKG